MPNKNYVNGRNREYKIANTLRSKGWIVVRASGSHSPIDLVAIDVKSRRCIFIQVKPKSMSLREKARIEEQHNLLNGIFNCRFKVVSLESELNSEEK